MVSYFLALKKGKHKFSERLSSHNFNTPFLYLMMKIEKLKLNDENLEFSSFYHRLTELTFLMKHVYFIPLLRQAKARRDE